MIPFNCTIKKEARQKASLFRMFVYSGALNNVFRTAPRGVEVSKTLFYIEVNGRSCCVSELKVDIFLISLYK